MSPTAELIEILWVGAGLAALVTAVLCYHYAALDARRLGRSGSNGVLERVAHEAVERELIRFLLLLLLTSAGILATTLPHREGLIPLVTRSLIVAATILLLVAELRGLAFRRWLLRRNRDRG